MRIGNLVITTLGLVLGSVAGAQTQVSSAPAGSTVIDFNSLSNGTPVTTQYAGLGVTISGGAFANSIYNYAFGGDPMQVANFYPSCDTGTCQPLLFTFDRPINFFGFDVISNGNVTFLEPYGSLTIPAGPSPASFAGFTDSRGFSWVAASADFNGAFVFDNLSFADASTVPEPSSMALLGLGLVGLIPLIRRRHV